MSPVECVCQCAPRQLSFAQGLALIGACIVFMFLCAFVTHMFGGRGR